MLATFSACIFGFPFFFFKKHIVEKHNLYAGWTLKTSKIVTVEAQEAMSYS